MKTFLLALFLITSAAAVHAQIRYTAKDSLVNTDTSIIAFNSVPSKVKSLEVTALKSSGTISAKIYFQGSLDGLVWNNIDSITLADVTTYQTKIVTVTSTIYNSYRSYVTTSGTQKFYDWFTILRRPDE
jgi:hypothetical protein